MKKDMVERLWLIEMTMKSGAQRQWTLYPGAECSIGRGEGRTINMRNMVSLSRNHGSIQWTKDGCEYETYSQFGTTVLQKDKELKLRCKW